MRYKTVVDSMTPLESVYMLEVTRKVDWNTMREVRGVAWLGVGLGLERGEVHAWVGLGHQEEG